MKARACWAARAGRAPLSLGILAMVGTACWGQTSSAAPAAAVPLPQAAPVVVAPNLCLPNLPNPAASPVPLDRPLSLADAIAVALAHQPQVTISQGQAEAAAGRTTQARSAELPQLNLSAQYNRTGPADRAGAPEGTSFGGGVYTTSVSARQLLLDFGRTPAEIAQARAQQTAAEQGLAQTRQDVINQVKQTYYTLLQNQGLVAVQARSLSDQQAHLNLAQARFDVGVAPRADVYRAQAAVAQAQFSLMQAQNAAAQARVNLNVAMGLDTRTPITVQETEEPEPPLPPLSAFLEAAYLQRPEVRQAEASVRAAEEGVRIARTSNLPTISADASYGLSGTSFPPDNRSWSYGVAVSWPLFDGGFTRGAVEAARGNLLSAQGQLRLAEQGVGQEVASAYLDVQAAISQVTTAAAAVISAEESLRVSVGRYDAGVATFVEVLDAETALLEAQTSQVNARYGLSLARAQLAHALGEAGA